MFLRETHMPTASVGHGPRTSSFCPTFLEGGNGKMGVFVSLPVALENFSDYFNFNDSFDSRISDNPAVYTPFVEAP
jgi:hypothetical protein